MSCSPCSAQIRRSFLTEYSELGSAGFQTIPTFWIAASCWRQLDQFGQRRIVVNADQIFLSLTLGKHTHSRRIAGNGEYDRNLADRLSGSNHDRRRRGNDQIGLLIFDISQD